MKNELTPFERLSSEFGTSAACSILNDKIGERMLEEHPEYYDLPAREREFLWMEYCDRYSGEAANELLEEVADELLS